MSRITPEQIAAIVADSVASALAAAGVEAAPVEEPEVRTSTRKRSRGTAKATAARKPRSKSGKRPFVANPDWKGQTPQGRMVNTVARLYADGHVTKAQYQAAIADKFTCSEVIGKGFAKAGIGR